MVAGKEQLARHPDRPAEAAAGTPGPPAAEIPARWWREPAIAPGDEVCLFVTVAPRGRIWPHNRSHAAAWAAAGFRTIIIMACDDLDAEPVSDDGSDLDFAAGILLRANRGYDFGAWAGAMARLPGLADAGLLALVNDSIVGPTDAFPALLARTRAAATADMIGVTMCHVPYTHFQSYLQFFRPRALRHPVFQHFWQNVGTGDRQYVIDHYEVSLLRLLVDAGLVAHALFRIPPEVPINTTVFSWRKLLEAGFPYLKLQVLRDNPAGTDLSGWRQELATRGVDPAPIEAYLRTVPVAALRVA